MASVTSTARRPITIICGVRARTRLREIEQLARREQTSLEAALDARIAGEDGKPYETARLAAQSKRERIEERLAVLSTVEPAPIALLRDASVPSDVCGEALAQIVDWVYPATGATERSHYKTGGAEILLKTAPGTLCVILSARLMARNTRTGTMKTSVTIHLAPSNPYATK